LGAEIGPLTSCPPGHVVTRIGKGLSIGKVWCRPEIRAAKPVARAPAPAPVTQVTVNPNIQTQVSPQISPIFQQTGQGSQSAGTSMTAPGGQHAPGSGADIDALMRLMADRDARAQEQARQAQLARDAEDKRRWDAEQARFREEREAREKALAERQAQYEAERAAIKAAAQTDTGSSGSPVIAVPGGSGAPAVTSTPAPTSETDTGLPVPLWVPLAVAASVGGLYWWRQRRA
jgi:hypothetical protein